MKRKAAIFILLVLIILAWQAAVMETGRPERQITGQMQYGSQNGKIAYLPITMLFRFMWKMNLQMKL